jgi:hypothetical protein
MSSALSPLAIFLLLSLAPTGSAAEPQRLAWDELNQLVGRHVSIPLYDGCAVFGKVTKVQSDALVIDVEKSSHPQAYPKGPLRVPRATLYVFELHKKGFKHRVTDTTLDVLGAVGVSGDSADRNTTTIRVISPPANAIR